MNTRPNIVLTADDFDALQYAAEANGGVGWGRSWEKGQPWCVRGLAQWAGGHREACLVTMGLATPRVQRLLNAGLTTWENDGVFLQAKRRQNERMTWKEYVAAMRIVRGNE